MTARRLMTERVEKVWGRRDLGPWFEPVPDDHAPVGEIWFEAPGDPELMVKFLFTSERLSIQVHPDDAHARAAGYPRGKDEAWVVLAAGPEAELGVGTVRPLSPEELRTAALDGSIETLLDWRRPSVGDVLYSPAGTVHAIGGDVTILEIQQNVDLTYRLYDYGRPRALHLEEGIAVARAEPFTRTEQPRPLGEGRTLIVDGPAFRVERWQGAPAQRLEAARTWVTLLAGEAEIDAAHARAGECWLADAGCRIAPGEGADIILSYV